MTPEDTIRDREAVYGKWVDVAEIHADLKRLLPMRGADTSVLLARDQICLKLARLSCGDHAHADGWHDIAGYALLAEQSITGGE